MFGSLLLLRFVLCLFHSTPYVVESIKIRLYEKNEPIPALLIVDFRLFFELILVLCIRNLALAMIVLWFFPAEASKRKYCENDGRSSHKRIQSE